MYNLNNNKTLKKLIQQFEKDNDAKLVYLTVSGSRLYGTNTPESDIDYKGIFVPSERSVLTKTDIPSFTYNSNNSNTKNTKDDIDLTLHSVYSFFNQLKKSETGAMDLLFSMYRYDTIVYEDTVFTKLIKRNVDIFKNKNMNSFIGYALGQAKKFGIKGKGFSELDKLVKILPKPDNKEKKLSDYKDFIENLLKDNEFKYIDFIFVAGPRTNEKEIEYLSVLGKKFALNLSYTYFLTRVKELYNQFGNRTKTIAKTSSKTDFKALSHSIRIAQEVQEYITTGKITFPLLNAEYIKSIKEGNEDAEVVMAQIQEVLEEVDEELNNSNLPAEVNNKKLEELLLLIIKIKG